LLYASEKAEIKGGKRQFNRVPRFGERLKKVGILKGPWLSEKA
jgi:hypothetical protein